MKPSRLSIGRPEQPPGMPPAPNRGRLLNAAAVVTRIGVPGIDERFVMTYVRPRVRLSPRKFAWYETDVDAWVASKREDPAA